jgi:glycosyltransferase involved in cell wall biosynthesis
MPVRQLAAFYQHMPPYSSAAALRGFSVACGLVQAMQQFADCRLRIYTTTPAPAPLMGAEILAIDAAEVENATGLAARMMGELRMGWVAARAMLKDAKRDDLILVSTPSYLAALVICARARGRGVAYVLDVRDIYPQAYAQAQLIADGGWLHRFFAARSKAMYRGARRIITATQGLAREVTSVAPDARVDCVYNGFPSSLSRRTAIKRNRFTACFHGVLGFFQDVDTLIEVARQVQAHGIDIVAIGYGRKEDALRCAQLANLHFLGRLSFDETIDQVEVCHVGLCLRMDDAVSRDAFPVKVWECLGLGMPSIVTPPCEAGEFLERHGCGIQLQAGDAEAIVAALLRLKNQHIEREAISARCRSAAARFTREQLGVEAALLITRDWKPIESE